MTNLFPPFPKGEFTVILADPPWLYEHPRSKRLTVESHYPTLTLEQICDLKIPAAANSALFLWSTAPKVAEAGKVMESWGFTHRSCAVWDKVYQVAGYWFQVQHEILLVGTKGKFKTPTNGPLFRSVIREPRTVHSKKPDIVNWMIEKMLPGETYLELFARRQYNDKWTAWGNETDKFNEDNNLKQLEGRKEGTAYAK